MSFIAEAFALVKPSLDGFAADLRTKLDGISASARTIKILPVIDAAAVRTLTTDLKARLDANPVNVPVTLSVGAGALRTLATEMRTQLEAVPITITVTPVLDAAVVRRLAGELEAAAGAVTVPVAAEGASVRPTLDPAALAALQSELRTQLQAATIPVRPVLDTAALDGLRSELRAQLGSVPVVVNPFVDTAVLRTVTAELRSQLEDVGVPVVPALDAAALRALQAELRTQVEAITVPLTPTIDAAALSALRAELATRLATAAITVRPVLDADSIRAITAEIRTRLEASPVPVPVTPTLDRGALRAVRASLRETPLPVPVQPTLNTASVRALRTDLRARLETVSFPVKAILDGETVREVRSEIVGLTRSVPIGLRPALEEGALAPVLAEIRTALLGEALVVPIRPALDADSLRKVRALLQGRLEDVPLPVTPFVNPSAVQALQAELITNLKVGAVVTPTIDAAALERLQAELASRFKAVPVSIKASLDAASLRALRTELRGQLEAVPVAVTPALDTSVVQGIVAELRSRLRPVPVTVTPRLNAEALGALTTELRSQVETEPITVPVTPVLDTVRLAELRSNLEAQSRSVSVGIKPFLDINELRSITAEVRGVVEAEVTTIPMRPVLDTAALEGVIAEIRANARAQIVRVTPMLNRERLNALRAELSVAMEAVPVLVQPVLDGPALAALSAEIAKVPVPVRIELVIDAAALRAVRAQIRERAEGVTVPVTPTVNVGSLRALRADLRARLEAVPIPVTPELAPAGLRALRAELRGRLEAVPVQVTPVLNADVLGALQADLLRRLETNPVEIPVTPVLSLTALRTMRADLRARLEASPVPVPVQPVLVANAVRTLRAELRERLETSPIPAAVRLVLAAGTVRQLRAEVAGTGIVVPVELRPTAARVRTAATSAAAAATSGDDVRGAQRAEAAQRAATQLQRNAVLSAKDARAATRAALDEELASLRQLTSARQQAATEARRAAAQGALGPTEATALQRAANRELTRSERALGEAQQFGVKQITKSFEAQVRAARQNVEVATSARASANAYRLLGSAEESIATLGTELAAAQEKAKSGLLQTADAANLSAAAKKNVTAAESALKVATEGGNAAQIDFAKAMIGAAAASQQEAVSLGHTVAAQREAAKQTNAMILGTNELRIAKDELKAATRVDVESQLAYNAAVASGQPTLIAYTEQMKIFAEARKQELAATIRDAEAQKAITAAQRPFVTGLDRINAAILRNDEALGSRRAVTNAINLQTRAIDAQAKIASLSTRIGAQQTASLRAQADATVAAATEQRALAEAELTSASAAGKAATTRSAATRGVVATAASFLGLRGAVLASTLPFLAATIAVTAFGRTLAASGQVQAAMNSFQAATGATKEQMAAAAAEAQKLGADVHLPATSAADAAVAMTELAKAGLSVKDSLAAARGTVELAAAANIKAGDAAKIVASQLNAFQLAGSEAAKVTDLLAAASIMAQGEISDFGLAFKQSATVARQSGLSINQTTALLTEFARAGLQGSDAGTSLRVMLLRLVPVSKAAGAEMRRLNVLANPDLPIGQQLPDLIDRYREALGKLNAGGQTRALRTIFGQDAIRAATILFGQNSAAFQNLIAEQGKGGFATRLTEARSRGLTGALDGTSSAISTLAADIGSLLSPAAESIVREFGRIAGGADKAVSALKPLVSLARTPFTLGFSPHVAIETAAIVAAGLKLTAMQKARAAASEVEASQIANSDKAVAAAQEARIAVDNEKTVVTEDNAARRASTAAVEAAGVVDADSAVIKEQVARTAAERETTTVVEAESGKRIAAMEAEAAAAAAANAEIGAASRTRVATEAASTAATTAAAGRTGLGGLLGGGIAARFGRLSVPGLIAGVASQQVGTTVGGTAGSIFEGAGLGAGVGAFFGLPGAAIGAGIGAAAAGLDQVITSRRRAEARDRSSFESKWNSMTFDEQRAVLDNVARQTRGRLSQALGERSPQTIQNEQNRAIRKFLSEHRVRLKRDPQVVAEIPALQDLILRGNQQFATAASGAVSSAAAGLGPGGPTVPSLEQIDLGRLLGPQPRIATVAGAVGSRIGPVARAQLEALEAQQRNDTNAFVEATQTLLRRREADLRRLQTAIRAPKANTKDLAKRIKQAFTDIAGFQQDIDTAISGVVSQFTPRLGRLQVAQAQAALTSSTADDAAIAAQVTQYFEGRLQRVEALAKGTKNRAKLISDATQQVISARQSEQQAQQSLVQEVISGGAALQANAVATARAGLTTSLTDDLAAARQRLGLQKETTAKVAQLVRAGTATTKDLSDALLAEIGARQSVSDLQKQARDQQNTSAQDTVNLELARASVLEAAAGLTKTLTDDQQALLTRRAALVDQMQAQQRVADQVARESGRASSEWKQAAGAVLATKQSVLELNSSLQDLADKMIDAGPLASKIKRLQGQLNRDQRRDTLTGLRRSLRDAREELARATSQADFAPGFTPSRAQAAAVDKFLRPFREKLKDAQNAIKDFNTETAVTKLQAAMERQKNTVARGLSDLAAQFNAKKLSLGQFNEQVAALLNRNTRALSTAGARQGAAFGRSLTDQVRAQVRSQGLTIDAKAALTRSDGQTRSTSAAGTPASPAAVPRMVQTQRALEAASLHESRAQTKLQERIEGHLRAMRSLQRAPSTINRSSVASKRERDNPGRSDMSPRVR